MVKDAPGPGVDAQGRPVVDPTQNVYQLVDAAIKRQDDLRMVEFQAIRREMELRSVFYKELREAESMRIDAIRAVDVDAVRRAAEVAAAAATTLQSQVQASAEAMRASVAAAAQAAAESQMTVIKPLADAIAALQQQQYLSAGGKQQVVESRDVKSESRLNVGMVVGIIGALIALATVFFMMVGIGVTIFVATRGSQ